MITAENMKEALESHSCLKGCRAAVVQVDTIKSVGVENKIPGISLLNNFLYEERGVRACKAYKVGPGCFIPYDKVIIERQGDTGLKVIQPFGARTKERGTIAEKHSRQIVFSQGYQQSSDRHKWKKDTSEYSTSQEFTEEDPDLEALETEITLENLLCISVNLQVTAPQHPIVVQNTNLCELSKARKPNKWKEAEVREICESLQLEVSGSLARKKLFIEPSETYAKCFTCFTRVENER